MSQTLVGGLPKGWPMFTPGQTAHSALHALISAKDTDQQQGQIAILSQLNSTLLDYMVGVCDSSSSHKIGFAGVRRSARKVFL